MSGNPFGDDPYGAPKNPVKPPVLDAGVKPPVWVWYQLYCVFMALLYGACLAGGILLLVYEKRLMPSLQSTDVMELRIQAVVMAVIGAALLILYVVALALPRNKLNWIVGFVTIGIGLTSCCCMPASIPLLIYWVKDETMIFLNAM